MAKISTQRMIVAGILLVALGACVAVAEVSTPRQPAPPIEGETLRHKPFSLADERGKVVLVQFWASWCVSCIDGLPELDALRAKYGEQGFEIVGISLDESLRDARRAISEHQIRWPQFCDGRGVDSTIVKQYGVIETPRYFLIDRSGRMATTAVPRHELSARVQALLAESRTPTGSEGQK